MQPHVPALCKSADTVSADSELPSWDRGRVSYDIVGLEWRPGPHWKAQKMLGYISSTRKKSCVCCVKAKRRCDLGYPACKRCSTKGLDCLYPNASVREAEVVVRQTTPDLIPPDGDVALLSSTGADIPQDASVGLIVDTALLLPSAHSSSPESDARNDCQENHIMHPQPRLPVGGILPQIWEPAVLSEAQVLFLVKVLKTFISKMASEGHTPFMHEALYRKWQPQAYQDSCSLSALYLMKTCKNISVLTNAIDSKIAALIASSGTWTLGEHLAAVQALIIYQIIRLFDPDLNSQLLAHKQNGLLELWAAHLWKRSFNEPDLSVSCYHSWVFQESLRRTVLMSVFLRGAWNASITGGLCDQAHVLHQLPVSKDGELWDADLGTWCANSPCNQQGGYLIAYGELSSGWKSDNEVERLTEFERLLLGACRGGDDPRLLSS